MTAKTYSTVTSQISGTTRTGLDQLINYIYADPGVAGGASAQAIATAATVANRMDQIILEAANKIGATTDSKFTLDEVKAMNQYIRQNYLKEWTTLHGDDDGDVETGYHLIQNDGGNLQYRGNNLINTVMDGIYHMGFEIKNDTFLNEDGNANATVQQVADWLTALYTDHSTTGSPLDRITDAVMADGGLSKTISEAQIEAGADAANGLNQLIMDGIKATGVLSDNWLSTDDVKALNTWLRADATRLSKWTALHGDDDGKTETGFHKVVNDGSNTAQFGKNLVNTVADGIYHLAFTIKDGNFLNEDGNANASVNDVTSWLNYYLSDQSTTGTGLDKIVDIIKIDPGLAANTKAADINEGARFANEFNKIIVTAITTTNAMSDGWITETDIRAMNAWIRADANRLATWTLLHGDDENGEETGYHLVQNDGANTNYFGQNLVNTVADGIYHLGFEIKGNNVLNEDGNNNASLTDLASWINYFYKGNALIYGSDNAETVNGTDDAEEIEARNGNDTINAGAGHDFVNGGWGADTILGGIGDDIIVGAGDDDTVNGQEGADTYLITGNVAGGWTSFQGFDTYADTGKTGKDTIKAQGDGNVDIGVRNFDVASGVEIIDASGAKGTVRLLGNDQANVLDLRNITIIGSNLLLDGGYGDDTIYGTAGTDTLIAGGGNDTFNLGDGSDIYQVTGNVAGGWTSFQGFDTYADNGKTGTDTIQALGDGNVDIGLKQFSATSGIEVVDATGAKGTVRLLGDDGSNVLDLSTLKLVGTNIVIDGGYGDDTITGTTATDTIIGGGGNDTLNLGEGGDTYQVSGNVAGGWTSFQGFDNYSDKGKSGTDTIKAVGDGNVDIGLKKFDVTTGIEVIDTSGAKGTVRLLGDDGANALNFAAVKLIGTNIILEGGYGDDTITGTAGVDIVIGGGGNDTLNMGDGSDIYQVTGNVAGGWTSFHGIDTYADTGKTGTDTIKALGDGNVDIGLKQFSATSGIEVIDASGVKGTTRLLGDDGANVLDFSTLKLIGTNIVMEGGYGDDTITGTAGADTIIGGGGNDTLNLGEGSDTYQISGNVAGGWTSFQGFDTYIDNGKSGTDTIKAVGDGNVDIGFKKFDATTGIEVIDASGAKGTVRLLGDDGSNLMDFSSLKLVGTNLVIDGGYGDDTITGTAGADTIIGGGGNDSFNLGEGNDVYQITGNVAGGWTSFQGFDIYADTGKSGTDIIKALGDGDVDVGLKKFDASTGIEAVDGSGAKGIVRLLGDDQANILNFSALKLLSTNIIIDGGYGDDTITGTAGADTIIAGGGNDTLNLGEGNDIYRVTGNVAGGWTSFQGYDTYTDTGKVGSDIIQALGDGNVDVGFKKFDNTAGIETIDGTGAKGTVRLLGDDQANILNFAALKILGTNVVMDGGYGDDTITGTAGVDVVVAGGGNDTLNMGNGADIYQVTGNVAGGWTSFQGYDIYADTGTSGIDTIKALGDGAVDIGLKKFDSTSGIEVVDGTGAKGIVRLLGDDQSNALNFAALKILGTNVVIDGGYGDDTITGTAGNDTVAVSGGNDILNMDNGSDTYQVTGNVAGGWTSFQGYDTYADKGTTGTDTIKALGDGAVDIGFKKFDASTGIEVIDGTGAKGTVRLLGDDQNNILDFSSVKLTGSNLVIDGGYGDDLITGNASANIALGGGGNDTLDLGDGADTYQVTGNVLGGWSSFQGYDIYADSGATGVDTIKALGDGNVDIGFKKFLTTNGIEAIDGTGAKGTVRLLGDDAANLLDFSAVKLIGSNLVIDGGYGDDTIIGNAAANIAFGGGGNDTLDLWEGADTYQVTGNVAGGWSSFQGYDTYADSGTTGVDTIKALGDAAVDIGLLNFDITSGIEVINGTGAKGTVRLLGNDSANVLDFSTVKLVGTNVVIDGGYGDDTIIGNAAANIAFGGGGNDNLDLWDGADTYQVTGNIAGGWSSFQGFDTYEDTGTTGIDTLKAIGDGAVDIGLKKFDASSGIEVIDGTGAKGAVRLVGDDSASLFDFRTTKFVGSNLSIDGGNGNDTIKGSAGNDIMLGGRNNDILLGSDGTDKLDGGEGDDILLDNAGKNDVLIGGVGRDRLVVGHSGKSQVDLWGGSTDAKDAISDTFGILNSSTAIDVVAIIHDFEWGKDKLDFSQLRAADNYALNMDDLTIKQSGNDTIVTLAQGVHTLDGASVQAQFILQNINLLTASDFAFAESQLPSGMPGIIHTFPDLFF